MLNLNNHQRKGNLIYIKRDINCKNNERLKKSNENSDRKELQVFDNKIFSQEGINCIN